MIKIEITASNFFGLDPPEHIATVFVINDLQHAKRPEMGSYVVKATGKNWEKKARVKNHKREHGIEPLLRMALKQIGKFRRTDDGNLEVGS